MIFHLQWLQWVMTQCCLSTWRSGIAAVVVVVVVVDTLQSATAAYPACLQAATL